MSIHLQQVTHNCAGSTLYGVVSEDDLGVVFNTVGGGQDDRWPPTSQVNTLENQTKIFIKYMKLPCRLNSVGIT